MAVSKNGIATEFDWFSEDYLRTEQDILKSGLDETAALREVDQKKLPHQEIYVQDEDGNDATLHLICFDGKVHLGVYAPSESENYQEFEEKTLPKDWFTACTLREFQKRIIETTIPSLIERGTLSLQSHPSKGKEPLTGAQMFQDLQNLVRKYQSSIERGEIKPAEIRKAFKACEAALMKSSKETPMGR